MDAGAALVGEGWDTHVLQVCFLVECGWVSVVWCGIPKSALGLRLPGATCLGLVPGQEPCTEGA